ncbi:hypothetical protein [Serratia liquefaciens]|uniref:hypothetical protein n=1 Tax=Serratia liquefaciens TaxID=614 RepID=UPI003905F249
MANKKLSFQEIKSSESAVNILSKDKDIAPGGYVKFIAYSNSIFHGAQGEAKYHSSNDCGFVITWDNPYAPWNNSRYSIKCDKAGDFFVFCKIDDSHDATANYYIYDITRIANSQLINIRDVDEENVDIKLSKTTLPYVDSDDKGNGRIHFVVDNMNKLLNSGGDDKIQMIIGVMYGIDSFEKYKEIQKNSASDIVNGNIVFSMDDALDGYTYILEINGREHKFSIDNGLYFPKDNGFKDTLVIGENYKQKIIITPNEQGVTLKFNSIFKNANTNGASKDIEGLPPGLNISSEDPFTIVGVPSQSGEYNVTVTAIREFDEARAIKIFNMHVVYDAMNIALKEYGTDKSLNDYVEIFTEQAFACEVLVSNGFPPYTIRVKSKDINKPALPVGVELWGSFIIGTASQKVGKYVFDVIATDRYGNLATKEITFDVFKQMQIFPENIDGMDINKLHEITLSSHVKGKAVDASSLKYHIGPGSSSFFGIDKDKLFVQKNVIPGVYRVNVFVTPSLRGEEGFIYTRRSYFIAIGKKLALSKKSLPRGCVGVSYNGEIEVNGATPPNYQKGIALIIPELPGGLELSPEFKIVGTPNSQGVFIIDVVAADLISNKDYGCLSYPIVIDGPPVAKDIRNRSFPAGNISIPLDDYISSTVSISGGTLLPSEGSRVAGTIDNIDNKAMLHLNIPYNTVGDVVLSYTVENKFGKSNAALIQFFVHE